MIKNNPAIMIVLSMFLIGLTSCVHMNEKAQPVDNNDTSVFKNATEEIESSVESPGVPTEESAKDEDVEIKF